MAHEMVRVDVGTIVLSKDQFAAFSQWAEEATTLMYPSRQLVAQLIISRFLDDWTAEGEQDGPGG